jgi:hypothetical protein
MKTAALAALLISVAASAQMQVRLQHSSDASSCPDSDTLQRLVAERLGRNPFTPDAAK